VHAFHSVLQPGGGTVLVVERGGPQSGTHVVAIRDGFGTELARTVLHIAPGRALAWKTGLGVVLYEPRARNFVFQPATPPVSRQAHALREFDGRVEYRRAGDEDFQPLGPRSNPFERLCNAGALIELRLRLEGGDATRPARIGRGGAIRVRHGGRTILRIAVDGGGVISVDGD